MLLSLLLWGVPAAAQDPSPGAGFAVGARAAYGIPLGKAFNDVELSNQVGNSVAFQVDVAYFLSQRLSLGAYFQYGFAEGLAGVVDNATSARVLRFGFDVDYHFAPEKFVAPWVGVGLGYELVAVHDAFMETEDSRPSSEYKGLELGHAHFGVDFQLTNFLAVGPYVTATLGQYSKFAARAGDILDVEGDIPSDDRSFHFWVQPGVRVQFRL
ncbi:porin family protein [Corallococcus exiguus]|nr:porin family protein [Corallococcus exiguus]